MCSDRVHSIMLARLRHPGSASIHLERDAPQGALGILLASMAVTVAVKGMHSSIQTIFSPLTWENFMGVRHVFQFCIVECRYNGSMGASHHFCRCSHDSKDLQREQLLKPLWKNGEFDESDLEHFSPASLPTAVAQWRN